MTMPPSSPPSQTEQQTLGQVLRRLRISANMNQAEAGERAGVSQQTWQRYEAGESGTVLKVDAFTRLARTLGFSYEDAMLERDRIVGALSEDRPAMPPISRSFAEPQSAPSRFEIQMWGRAWASPQGPQVADADHPTRTIDLFQVIGADADAMEIAGESVVPWGEPGERVIFNRGSWPRRGRPCVIETKTGELYVKFYERQDGSTLFVRELFPEERTITFPMENIKGVYAVRAKLE